MRRKITFVPLVPSRTYAEKLKDPRWIARADEVKERARHRCEECGTSKNLEVHHVIYPTGVEPWDVDDWVLMCLCGNHHEERQSAEQVLFGNVAQILRYKKLPELLAQPLWTMFDSFPQETITLWEEDSD